MRLRCQHRHALFAPGQARGELARLDQALRIAVDQTANPPSQNPHLLVELDDLLRSISCLAHLAKAPIVLVGYALRGLQNSSDLLPD